MKILLAHPDPFLLAHGGFQIQIEQTARALVDEGVEVETLRWWDERQTGDIIHHFGRPHPDHVRMARKKGIRFVFTELLTSQGSRSKTQLALQSAVAHAARQLLPASISEKIGWESYRLADRAIALTEWEAELMHRLYGAPKSHIDIVPNGVEAQFFDRPPDEGVVVEKDHLLCVATIAPRKSVVELAEAAICVQVPLVLIGSPYSEHDLYFKRFEDVVRRSGGIVRYVGGVADRVELAAAYRRARGFVLLSSMESQSLSALEAAASDLPLLLSDLPWARSTFRDRARYCDYQAGTKKMAVRLRDFYQAAPGLARPSKPTSWRQVAVRLRDIYGRILRH